MILTVYKRSNLINVRVCLETNKEQKDKLGWFGVSKKATKLNLKKRKKHASRGNLQARNLSSFHNPLNVFVSVL